MRPRLLLLIGLVAAVAYATVPSAVYAQQVKEICDNGIDDDKDKDIDCDDSDCAGDEFCKPPAPKGFCHNIGGPELAGGGANCDPVSGVCTVTEQEEPFRTFSIGPEEFFGTIIGTSSAGAILAHLAHGDGPTVEVIDPVLHLSSQGDNHKAANVECIGTRDLEDQPEEPGN